MARDHSPKSERDNSFHDSQGYGKKSIQFTQGDEDDLKALETAINFEAKGFEFYTKLRDDCIDSVEKAFFNLLANIEHEHYISLKDTQELMTYQIKERTGLDGA